MKRITRTIEKAYFRSPQSTPPAVRSDWVLPIITDAQLEDKVFVRAVRERGYAITLKYGITPGLWHPFLITAYQDFEGWFMDKKGNEFMINTQLFEIDEKTLYGTAEQVKRANEMRREKFETLF
jgi:hypothetical protein